MKAIAVNGSPRKNWNTGTLLKKALEGAQSEGADTEIYHLYDYSFKGCNSCFACKIRGGKSYGKCAVKDDIAPVYEMILEADLLLLGSPIYFSDITGAMRSFIERLLFPYLAYSEPRKNLFPHKISVGLIYTMNCPEKFIFQFGYDRIFNSNEQIINMVLGNAESLMSYDTYQFEDYSKVVADGIDEENKRKRRGEIFPLDCENAFKLGKKLILEQKTLQKDLY